MRSFLSFSVVAASLIAVSSLVACAAPAADEAGSETTNANLTDAAEGQIVVGEADANKTVEVTEGQKVVVSLASNRTTGFSWELTNDGDLGTPATDYILPQDAAIGTGGYQTFTFGDTRGFAGSHSLELVYQRPWAETVPPAKTFKVTIVVVAHEHHCGGFPGLTCGAREFCSYERGETCGMADAMGTCQVKPAACAKIYMPVCGCNGHTFGNECEAAIAGVGVLRDGECASNN